MIRVSRVCLDRLRANKGRGQLSAKRAPIGFKKGFGAIGLGKHTKKGK